MAIYQASVRDRRFAAMLIPTVGGGSSSSFGPQALVQHMESGGDTYSSCTQMRLFHIVSWARASAVSPMILRPAKRWSS